MGYALLLIPVGIAIGVGIGVIGAKASNKVFNSLLEKRALKMLKGKIDNKYELDGERLDVNVFKFRNKNGEEDTIKLRN